MAGAHTEADPAVAVIPAVLRIVVGSGAAEHDGTAAAGTAAFRPAPAPFGKEATDHTERLAEPRDPFPLGNLQTRDISVAAEQGRAGPRSVGRIREPGMDEMQFQGGEIQRGQHRLSSARTDRQVLSEDSASRRAGVARDRQTPRGVEPPGTPRSAPIGHLAPSAMIPIGTREATGVPAE
jgi:hypothetical protein